MTNLQLKSIQENIFSIREIAVAMLESSDSHMIELAHILSDRVTDIEMELYNQEPAFMSNISEDDFRELLTNTKYEVLAITKPLEEYELIMEEEQVEKLVDSMDKADLQIEAIRMGYSII